MPGLIIIGGAPRCGKSTLVNTFLRKKTGWDTVRLDFFTDLLSASFNHKFLSDEEVLSWDDAEAAIFYYNNRDKLSSSLAKPYIEKLLLHGHNVICEGLFPPGYSQQFAFAKTAEYHLIRQTNNFIKQLDALEAVNQSDLDPRGSWTSKLTDSELHTFAKVEIAYANSIAKHCEEAGLDSVIIDTTDDFDLKIHDVITELHRFHSNSIMHD